MKKAATLLLGLTMSFATIAQTFNVGGPVSFNSKLLSDDSKMNKHVMPFFNLEKQLEEDLINRTNKVGPFRFGYEHITNYSLQNAGIWQTTDEGDRVWKIKFSSPGALSMNVIFNDFFIPEGGSVHLYNKETDMVVGAYTEKNNNVNSMLGTDLIKGETVVIEYFEPSEVTGQGRLLIGMVVHGYVDINNWYPVKIGESGTCNKDVVCWDACDWLDEIRSVARIAIGGGLCTGTLINNTSEDGTPYFLTANHCGPSSMGSAVFKFNYNSTNCSSSNANASGATNGNSVNGSTFKASNSASDFGLIELNTVPPASYEVFYAGWEAGGASPQTAVGIHHPAGDVKKLAFDDDPLTSAAGLSIANSSWRIEAWERNTTTEGGSSGSGLWDENHHLVGQLHGGQANCSNSINDYYGKFSMSWTGNGSSSSSSRLSDWLDPSGSGVTSLDGYDPNGGVETPAFCLTSVKEIDNNVFFEMYPNPASSSVIVNLVNGLDNVSIELVDIQGRLISSYNNPTGASMKVDLSLVSNGVYFIKVSSDGAIQMEKLIVE
ncbi:T9SS type A sorting domain-containing protein [Flavobacteriales bacterium]|nr:T9SS type A sorting domain-containing protein [Flavobacteriales bacterium]